VPPVVLVAVPPVVLVAVPPVVLVAVPPVVLVAVPPVVLVAVPPVPPPTQIPVPPSRTLHTVPAGHLLIFCTVQVGVHQPAGSALVLHTLFGAQSLSTEHPHEPEGMHTGVGSGVHSLLVVHTVHDSPSGQATHAPVLAQKGVAGVPAQSADVVHGVRAVVDRATSSSGAWPEQPPNADSPTNPRTPTQRA
jgi:hypothetical protein